MFAATTGGPAFEVSGWVASIITVGAVCAALTAVFALFRRSKLGKPIRWVYSRLLGQPVTTFFQTVVGDIVESHIAPLRYELTPNHGTSLVDKVDKLVRSADDSNARLVNIEEARKLQVPLFLEDHAKLAELHGYAHKNTHAINSAIAQLSIALQYAEGFVPALGSVGEELKATRQAITAAKGDAAAVIETARAAAENVLREAREHQEPPTEGA